MITPQFEVRQDDGFVYVDIRAPYIKASHIQFEVAENVFVFSLPPYYLRLRFPRAIKEDEFMTSSYDLNKAVVHCKVSKMHKGEHFADLDMISKLLATKREQESAQQNKPLIQDLDANVGEPDFDWEIDQEIPQETSSQSKYGFNNQYSERVNISMHNGNEINELAEPEQEAAPNRKDLMRQITTEEFDPGHYAADLFDDEMIQDIIKFQLPTLELVDELKDRIMKLGQREFFIENQKATYIGVIPLVFAWAYDFRVNYGDSSVESSWTVGKLCPSMSFLYNDYSSVGEVVADCTARALVKPLYRHWDLTVSVWQDTLAIIRQGRSKILVVFAHLLQIFEHDLHAVYRQILVEDYAIWIQYASDRALQGMCSELEKSLAKLSKSGLYLPIEETEQRANEPIGSDEGDSDDESESDSDESDESAEGDSV